MELNDVFDTLGNALDTIPDLRVFDYFADKVLIPGAVVSFPDSMGFDAVYKGLADRLTIPVIIVVGRLDARNSRILLSAYCGRTGDKSVKRVLESFVTPVWDSLRVRNIQFGILTYNGIEYLGATFDVDVIGKS